MIEKKNELFHSHFLPLSSFFSPSDVRQFFCIETKKKLLSVFIVHTRIQFMCNSVRHTPLNGNMAEGVERRKELVHTHTFLCV